MVPLNEELWVSTEVYMFGPGDIGWYVPVREKECFWATLPERENLPFHMFSFMSAAPLCVVREWIYAISSERLHSFSNLNAYIALTDVVLVEKCWRVFAVPLYRVLNIDASSPKCTDSWVWFGNT